MFGKASILTGLLCLSVMAECSVANAAVPAGTNNYLPVSGPALPSALRPVLYPTLAHEAGSAYVVNKDGCATLPNETLTACFGKSGVSFSGAGNKPLALRLTSWGRGNALLGVKTVKPIIADSRVSYAHGALTEWWRILPVGFEQGFTISKRPVGNGALTLALAANGNAATVHGSLAFGRLHYGKLVVTDAADRVLPSEMMSKDGRIMIAVNDADAHYPVTIDPLVWNEQKISANDGAYDEFGFAVALSGNTALVAAPYANVGANSTQGKVWVFKESGGNWIQTAALIANDGAQDDYFGSSVALSGTTALVGAWNANVGGNAAQGAAYVFQESGGSWSQTAKLTASDGAAYDWFGYAVALDGSTALISAPYATIDGYSQGAAYVFAKTPGGWIQAAKLTASDSNFIALFGSSVAVVGSTAIVGASGTEVGNNVAQGTAYVYGNSEGGWTQTAILSASAGAAYQEFGSAVALDGSTAIIGAPAPGKDPPVPGAAYVFKKSGGNWNQTQKLTPNDGVGNDYFGSAVALLGASALIGAPNTIGTGNPGQGKAYRFDEEGGTWEQTAELAPDDGRDGDLFGYSVTLLGTSAIIGSPISDVGGNPQGASYVYTASCPQGYSEHNGSLSANGRYSAAPYEASAGMENGILGAPGGFKLFVQYSNGESSHIYRIPNNEIHKQSPAGTYRWGVKAGNTSGSYVLCVLHP